MSKYQGRICGDVILGRGVVDVATDGMVPRVMFTDPQVSGGHARPPVARRAVVPDRQRGLAAPPRGVRPAAPVKKVHATVSGVAWRVMPPDGTTASLDQLEQLTLNRAADRGFDLLTYETEQGHSIFEWRRNEEPGPQFPTRRAALEWMTERLADPPAP
jgi:hypothetical protein